MSAASLSQSASSSIDDDDEELGYVNNDLPQLDPYVDPYASLQLPPCMESATSAAAAAAAAGDTSCIDERLVGMAAESLKELLEANAVLDRERLEIIRTGLLVGGITAATIWYCLPWLHFELMQYDAGRQQLIAMMLSFSHTCPADVTSRFRDLAKYTDLQTVQGQEVACVEGAVLSPSQAWRFVVRPLIARDPDLFYSDFKLMVVGVARWSLQASSGR
ncbi:hypothetical protein IWW38_004668 [Coemansia aciculifera]|uniref:Uncharacterized protein n=1 Tax=Coemansia aciculifera TaxID=417176 RepID=A0ACC1LXA2_9FUNG|nr:hypothetical protein IWW38_004668 [Coemansia aciculifera]